MIKAEDEYTSTADILLKDKLVVSKLTIEQLSKNGAAIWQTNLEEHTPIASLAIEPNGPAVDWLKTDMFKPSVYL